MQTFQLFCSKSLVTLAKYSKGLKILKGEKFKRSLNGNTTDVLKKINK